MTTTSPSKEQRVRNGWLSTLTLVSALGSGLIAGVFFAFSSFVMGALARLPADQGIAAMQSINRVVINPVFMLVFLGTAVGCAAIGVASIAGAPLPGARCLLAGCAAYLLGTLLVTMAFNVPRNNALAALDPAGADSAAFWRNYVSGWTAWNHVRMVAAAAAATLLTLGR